MTHTAERVQDAGKIMEPKPQPPNRTSRTVLGWAAVVLALLLAIGLAVAVLTFDDSPSSSDRNTTAVENRVAPLPQSANAAEHGLSSRTGRLESSGSANAAELRLGSQPGTQPGQVRPESSGSANAAEQRLGTQPGTQPATQPGEVRPESFGSANAAEHRLHHGR